MYGVGQLLFGWLTGVAWVRVGFLFISGVKRARHARMRASESKCFRG